MAKVTIAEKRNGVELSGIETADARDIFSAYVVREEWGAVYVEGCKVSTARAKLRDAGHQTALAK
jgi:hypothetical protein